MNDKNFPFDIVAIVENKGDYDVPVGGYTLSLTGIDLSEFGITTPTQLLSKIALKRVYLGENNNIIQGGKNSEIWNSPNGFLGNLDGSYQYIVRVDICYEYITVGKAQICTKKNKGDNVESICNKNGYIPVESSSGPIQISNFAQQINDEDNSVNIQFKISSEGAGKPFKSGSGCPIDDKEIRRQSEDRIEISVTTDIKDNLKINCLQLNNSNSGIIIIYNGEQTIKCTVIPLNNKENNIANIHIEAKYAYRDHIEGGLLVKHISD